MAAIDLKLALGWGTIVVSPPLCPLRLGWLLQTLINHHAPWSSNVDCCVLVSGVWNRQHAPRQRTAPTWMLWIVVSCLPSSPPNSWLLHPPVDPRPLDLPLNLFEPVGGQLFHPFPLPRTTCAEKQLQPAIAPSSCCRWGCFVSRQPQRKIDSLEGSGGKRRHQRWCLMALVAIVRWFGGHRTWFRFDRIVDRWWWRLCVLCVEESSCVMVIAKITDVDTLCRDERWLSMLDLREWILTNTSYAVSDIRIVHFQGKILWNVEVRAQCT